MTQIVVFLAIFCSLLVGCATDRPATVHTPRTLRVVRPDYVRVEVPIRDPYADTCSFDVMKRRGRWIVDGHGGGVRGLARGENVIVY